MGEIIRVITEKSHWISEEDINLIAKEEDISFSSLDKVNINGEKNGLQIGDFNFKDEDVNEKDFPTAYWSYDFNGTKRVPGDSYHSFRTTLEKTVFFQLTVSDNVPENTSIKFQLWEKDSVQFMDDGEFNEQKIFKWGNVRKVDGKNRITIEVFLENSWKKEIAKDRGSFQNGCIELYWKWEYQNTDWHSRDVDLSVYPSDFKLRLKPAIGAKKYPLPEIYSHKGDIVVFAVSQLPNGEIQKFVSIKISTTTTYTSLEGINKFKKEVYTEAVDLSKNKIQSANYHVEEVNHFFKVQDDFKKIFIETETVRVPVAKGSGIAVYNSIKKAVSFGKQAADIYGNILVLDEMRNMIPGLSNNGKFNLPSLATFVGFIPGAQIISFGISVLEWMAKDVIKEMNEWVDEAMWVTWQNTKKKGLEAAKSFKDTYWAMDKGFDYIEIDQETMNSLLKGKFNTINELRSDSFKNMSNDSSRFTVFTYRVMEDEIDDYFDVVDCIFTKD